MSNKEINEITAIYEMMNQLGESSDKRRDAFNNALLTIYTSVTSGSFLLSINTKLSTQVERWLFFIFVALSVSIILVCLLEKFIFYLSSREHMSIYVKNVKEARVHSIKPLRPKKWQVHALLVIPILLFVLLALSLLIILLFIRQRVL